MTDHDVADRIVDEIAQKGVSLDDKQWDFAVGAIAAEYQAVQDRIAVLEAGLREAKRWIDDTAAMPIDTSWIDSLLHAPKGDT